LVADVNGFDNISFIDRFAHCNDELIGVDFRAMQLHEPFDENGKADNRAKDDDQ
jgi:hypothetical protein